MPLNLDLTLGASCAVFAATSCGHVFLQRYNKNNDANNNDMSTEKNAKITNFNHYKEKGKMKRNDSEFSIGLTNSLSISNDLNELGPTCLSGYFNSFCGGNIFDANNLLAIGISCVILYSIGQSVYDIYDYRKKMK